MFILPTLTVCLSHKRCVVSAKHVAPLSTTPGVHLSISEILQAEKGNSACHSVGTVPSASVSRVVLSLCGFTLPVPSLAANGQSGHFTQVKPLWQEIISGQHDVLLQGGFSHSRNEGYPGKRQELRGKLRNRTGKETDGSRATGERDKTTVCGWLGPSELCCCKPKPWLQLGYHHCTGFGWDIPDKVVLWPAEVETILQCPVACCPSR